MSSLLKPIVWNRDIASHPEDVAWIWPGLLAEGNLTLLTGEAKCGKTTLLSLLLDRRREGNAVELPLLLNRGVRPGATVIISEETEVLWRRRQRHLDFGPDVAFWCRPFAGRPTPEHWRALLEQLLELHSRHGVDLVVIDPLAMFLPANENLSGSLLGPLADLQLLTEAGLAVLLLHHPAKGEQRLGQAARGSTALTACADILLELRVPRGQMGTRRRRLFGFSRYEETPRGLALELSADGADYAVLRDTMDDDSFAVALRLVMMILQQAEGPLTRQQILAAWPAELARPEPTTLWRWLTRATGCGALVRSGEKRKGYRYAITQRKE